ncbi:uncharacterized protein LOC109539164 isoform X1 [Dendroctonus ponderosae]|uniref:uncharacterized protein LOC109539164 isoform X1 n=2 Tax=Dendroctonus ponderosae TaxID=77166 RepID=UPI0020355FC3|nr:uncharacterized protein LOC109539164 isoform X1 [Dendroctonus ponderosae]XP_048526533.1 uncharacterized protein LOC109539164 isoform X1 [Dendroctonus ponderosae]
MPFTKSVPAQAASWRETSSHNIRSATQILFDQSNQSIGYARLRRGLLRFGDDEIRESLRNQSDRHYTPTKHHYGSTDRFCGLQQAASAHQVSVNPSEDVTTQNPLKMEEFSDLSALLMGANVEFIDSTDELNTPVFDKEAFKFPQQSTPAKPDKIKANPKVKVETLQHYSYSDLNLSADNQVHTKENCCSLGNEQSEMYLYQPFAQSLYNQGAYSPVFLQDNTAINQPRLYSTNLSSNNHFNSTTTSPQDDRYSYISSPANLQPEPTGKEQLQHTLRLNLMAERFKFPIKEEAISTLNTPDVIDEVVQMGTDFNILDLVDNEDISIINEDEAFVSTLTSPTAFKSEPSTPSTTTSRSSSIRRTKKRKMFQLDDADDGDDDDDDYIPPTYKKRSSAYRLAANDMDNSDSSDDSLEQPTKPRTRSISVSKTRGRPPKRGESVSSDGSKDQDVSKYRELRDKNNEASRKSRLKRKVQEREYEKEAADLYAKNIRLKTQVEELEKMVESFRNNLFQMLVTK